jgi:hypothetical protein
MQQLAIDVGLDLNEPVQLCAALQFKSTKLGWDLIRAVTAVDRARITRTHATRALFIQPDNRDLLMAKMESDELLLRRERAMHLFQEVIARTNFAIEALDDCWDNQLIERTSEPYRALMSTIEIDFDFDFDAMMTHKANNMNPLLYWLEARQDIDSICNEVLDGSQVTESELQAITLIHGASLHLPEQPMQGQ